MSKFNDRYKGRRHPIEDLNDWLSSEYPWDWDDYRSVKEWSKYPVIGRYFGIRMQELEDEENERYMEDFARNTGIDLSDNPYPIRNGLYGRVDSTGDYFSANASLISGFSNRLLRWFD